MYLKVIGYTLLAFESLWGAFWVVSALLLQFSESDPAFRSTFSFTALHTANAIAVYTALRNINMKRPLRPIAFLIFAFSLVTDVNGLLETTLHLSGLSGNNLYGIVFASTVTATTLSALALTWFSVLYYSYGKKPDKMHQDLGRWT